MSLSVIVPTIGRPSLKDTLGSIAPQLVADDEVLVVSDGDQPDAGDIVAHFDDRFIFMEAPGPSGDWGATPRNHALDRAKGSHLIFMDDDDVFLPTAFKAFRRAIRYAPEKPHLFKMYLETRTIWDKPIVEMGNVSTQTFLIPNLPKKVGRWTSRYEGDFDFLLETLSYYPEGEKSVVWKDEFVAALKSHKMGVF